MAVVRSRGVAAKQGFLMYYTKGVAIGTEVSVRYKESGRFSGVVVKRGSTVYGDIPFTFSAILALHAWALAANLPLSQCSRLEGS